MSILFYLVGKNQALVIMKNADGTTRFPVVCAYISQIVCLKNHKAYKYFANLDLKLCLVVI